MKVHVSILLHYLYWILLSYCLLLQMFSNFDFMSSTSNNIFWSPNSKWTNSNLKRIFQYLSDSRDVLSPRSDPSSIPHWIDSITGAEGLIISHHIDSTCVSLSLVNLLIFLICYHVKSASTSVHFLNVLRWAHMLVSFGAKKVPHLFFCWLDQHLRAAAMARVRQILVTKRR